MNQSDIDKYLLNEMPETEREQFEDQFVSDDALFYEIAARENELVDHYASGELSGDELERFDRSLAAAPARRAKIANAKMLREFIAGERTRNKTITIAERAGFFSKLFSFGPALQFASAAAIVLLVVVSIFLLTENRRLNSLQQELAASRAHESELAAQIETERETSGDLTADLDRERQRIQALEVEIAKLRNAGERLPVSGTPSPTIATLVLSTVGIRGDAVPVKRLELSTEVERVSIVAGLRADAAITESVSIKLNGEEVSRNLKPRIRRGEKSVGITLPAVKLKTGRNDLTIEDSKGGVSASYIITVTRP